MQPQTGPQARPSRLTSSLMPTLALGLGLAAGVAGALASVASARPAEPNRLPGPEISTELQVLLAAEPEAAAILMLDAPADDDRAIARAQARALAALGADFVPLRHYAHVPALAGRLRREALGRLDAVPGLVAASGDPELHAFLDDSTKFIGSDRLRRQGVTGSGVNVAVIDTGVDATHIDLRDAVVAQLCTLVPRDRCGSGDNPASDLDGHGTHVAGIVGSRGKRSGYGVASGAGIIAVKYLEARATGAGSNMIEALDLLLGRDDVDVINMSLGTALLFDGDCDDVDAYSRALASAFGRLRAAGAVAVAASGNDGSSNKLASPACIASVVSVGAIDDADRSVADFTNRGPNLDLLAPGVAIISDGLRGGVDTKSGTSMASPHVAGAFALLMAEAPWASPDLLEQVLKENGQRPTVRLGGNEAVTIKVDAALTALLRLVPTATVEPPTATPAPPTATPEPATPTPTAAPASPTPSPMPASPTADVPTATSSPVPPSASPEPNPLRPVYLPRLMRP